MSEQDQNGPGEKPPGEAEFNLPDCCGPMMDRMRSVDGEKEGSKGRSFCEEMMSKMSVGENPMESCPMSKLFRNTSGKRGFAILATLPGLLLVLVGVAIIFEPQILVWLLAAISIGAGLMLLAAATFFRKFAANLRT
jgi:hypothetical protein